MAPFGWIILVSTILIFICGLCYNIGIDVESNRQARYWGDWLSELRSLSNEQIIKRIRDIK